MLHSVTASEHKVVAYFLNKNNQKKQQQQTRKCLITRGGTEGQDETLFHKSRPNSAHKKKKKTNNDKKKNPQLSLTTFPFPPHEARQPDSGPGVSPQLLGPDVRLFFQLREICCFSSSLLPLATQPGWMVRSTTASADLTLRLPAEVGALLNHSL